MPLVEPDQSERIIERRDRILEPDAVLPPVLGGFGGVPFEPGHELSIYRNRALSSAGFHRPECEKGRGANHDPSEVKRCQAPAGKTTIQRKQASARAAWSSSRTHVQVRRRASCPASPPPRARAGERIGPQRPPRARVSPRPPRAAPARP